MSEERKTIACPYCGAEVEKNPDPARSKPYIGHKRPCRLGSGETDAQLEARGCPPEMMGIDHGKTFSLCRDRAVCRIVFLTPR
jgi:hypothetical protein